MPHLPDRLGLSSHPARPTVRSNSAPAPTTAGKSRSHVDMVMPEPALLRASIAAAPQHVDLRRAAMIWRHAERFRRRGVSCDRIGADLTQKTSPAFCTEATLWNVKTIYGFVTASERVIEGVETAQQS